MEEKIKKALEGIYENLTDEITELVAGGWPEKYNPFAWFSGRIKW